MKKVYIVLIILTVFSPIFGKINPNVKKNLEKYFSQKTEGITLVDDIHFAENAPLFSCSMKSIDGKRLTKGIVLIDSNKMPKYTKFDILKIKYKKKGVYMKLITKKKYSGQNYSKKSLTTNLKFIFNKQNLNDYSFIVESIEKYIRFNGKSNLNVSRNQFKSSSYQQNKKKNPKSPALSKEKFKNYSSKQNNYNRKSKIHNSEKNPKNDNLKQNKTKKTELSKLPKSEFDIRKIRWGMDINEILVKNTFLKDETFFKFKMRVDLGFKNNYYHQKGNIYDVLGAQQSYNRYKRKLNYGRPNKVTAVFYTYVGRDEISTMIKYIRTVYRNLLIKYGNPKKVIFGFRNRYGNNLEQEIKKINVSLDVSWLNKALESIKPNYLVWEKNNRTVILIYKDAIKKDFRIKSTTYNPYIDRCRPIFMSKVAYLNTRKSIDSIKELIEKRIKFLKEKKVSDSDKF